MKWSLAIIARDNEHTIGQTLEGVKSFIDEIIVVDTGSLDKTKEVAESYGAITYDFEWIDDFAAARNFAFSKATGDWIMWLDTGDIITPESAEKWAWLKQTNIINERPQNEELIWAEMNRCIEPSTGRITFHYPVPRMAYAGGNPKWQGAIHETLGTDGGVSWYFDGGYVNDPFGYSQKATDRNIKILQRLIDKGDTTPRTAYYYANELRDLDRNEEAIAAYHNFLQLQHFTWEYYEALISLSKVHRRMKQDLEASGFLFQAMYYAPERAEAWLLLGDVFYEGQHFAKAMPFYRACLGAVAPRDGAPVFHPAYGHLPLERLGFCYLGIDDVKSAINSFHEAAKLAETDHDKKILKDFAKKLRNAQQ
jgi:glycosyltransferase involved in cell wall biosynthesis